jgi:hypothetical protein
MRPELQGLAFRFTASTYRFTAQVTARAIAASTEKRAPAMELKIPPRTLQKLWPVGSV